MRTLIAPAIDRKQAAWRQARSGGRWSAAIAASVVWLTACGGAGGPAPTAVVSATPAAAAPAVAQAATPAPSPAAAPTLLVSGSPTPAPAAASSPRPASPAAASTPSEQRLPVGRSASYQGLLFTVEEARSGQTIEGQAAPRGRMLVGLHLRLENPNSQEVKFLGSAALHRRLRLHHISSWAW